MKMQNFLFCFARKSFAFSASVPSRLFSLYSKVKQMFGINLSRLLLHPLAGLFSFLFSGKKFC